MCCAHICLVFGEKAIEKEGSELAKGLAKVGHGLGRLLPTSRR